MKVTPESSTTRAGGSSWSASAITSSKAGAVLKSISPPMLTTATPSRCATEVVIGSAADTAILHLESFARGGSGADPRRLANWQKYYFNGCRREARLV